MSEVSEAAVVSILIADYAAADSVEKLNIIGGGVSVLGLTQTGATTPFALVVIISLPPALYRSDCSVEIVLEDSSGNVVSVPGPTTEPQLMRVAQAVTFDEPPPIRGVLMPRDALRARKQFVLNFTLGLPLAMGEQYAWRVKIDGDTRDHWAEIFVVPRPNPGPVIG
jgi:hypothetical protein